MPVKYVSATAALSSNGHLEGLECAWTSSLFSTTLDPNPLSRSITRDQHTAAELKPHGIRGNSRKLDLRRKSIPERGKIGHYVSLVSPCVPSAGSVNYSLESKHDCYLFANRSPVHP